MIEEFRNEPFKSFEVTQLAEPVWNPIEFLPQESWDRPDTLDVDFFEGLVHGAMGVAEKLGCDLAGTYEMGYKPIRGMEVGDDRVDVCQNPWPLAVAIFVQSSVYGFETSWKDTGISRELFNFCEVTSLIPSSRQGSITFAKRRGFDQLEFVDTPPLRIIIDVQKGDRGHSSSSVGKASMHGVRTVSARTSCKPVMEISGWVQDSTLNTASSPDPKYLPRVLGGSGAPSLWGDPVNMYLYLKSFKRGTYERVYGSAISELRKCVSDLDRGQRTQPVLCSFLRAREDYLHITYGANVMVPIPPMAGTAMMEPPEPLYKALGGTALLQGVENRLIQAGKLLTRTGALSEMKVTTDILGTLFGDKPVALVREEQRISALHERQRFDGALRANSAVQRLLAREANEHDLLEVVGGNFLTASSGTTHIDRYQCEWIHLGGRGEAYSIQDLLFSEDMYLREEVSMERTMKIGGIPLRPILRGQSALFRTEARIGLWQISDSQEAWADKTVQELLLLRKPGVTPGFQEVFPVYYKNREWVSDDSLLIGRASQIAASRTGGAIALVSADNRLARVMARTTGLTVAVVSPLDLIKNGKRERLDAESAFTLLDAFGYVTERNLYHNEIPPLFDELLVDTGSLAAVAQRVSPGLSVDGRATSFHHTETIRTGVNTQGRRFEVNRLTLLNGHHPMIINLFYRNGDHRRVSLGPLGPELTPKDVPQPNRSRAFLSRFTRR